MANKFKKLLIVSRASYRIEDGKCYFQHLDGPYLSNIAKYFDRTTIIASLQKDINVTNLTYEFARGVVLLDISPYTANPLSLIYILITQICKANIVFAFMPLWRSFLAGCISKILHKKLICYSGNPWHESVNLRLNKNENLALKSSIKKVFDLLEGFLIRIADIRILNNNRIYKKYGFLPFTEKTKPLFKLNKRDIYYRVDTCQSALLNIVAVGHVIPRKGYEYLIEGFARFLKQRDDEKDCKLNIIGNNTYSHFYIAKLLALCDHLGVTKEVVFHGEVNRKDDYLRLLRQMDIFVISSISEGFPRVLWEAMSQSLPIVASDLPNIKMEISEHPRCILLVDPGKPDQICDGLVLLSKNPELRVEMINSQRKYLRRILEETAVDQFIRLCEQRL